jgi:hypothetical protein
VPAAFAPAVLLAEADVLARVGQPG